MNIRSLVLGALQALVLSHPLCAMVDNAHFWRATNFFGEPRYEESWLSSFDASVGYGSTGSSRNSDHNTTDLLNLYGPHNIQKLGDGVPGKDPNNPLDIILINLSLEPGCCNFGKVHFDGRFSVVEAGLQFTQNFSHGFFAQVQVPIRSMTMKDFCRCDLTPKAPIHPDRNNPNWLAFWNNFESILDRYCLKICNWTESGVGDIAVLAGWTANHESTEVLDFIDVTFRTGFLAPSGRERNLKNPFSIANGYDGHWGMPLILDTAVGLYEWLNLGIHIDALLFFDTTKTVPMKTALSQNGFIKLARGIAKVDRGTLWDIGAYLKADHFARGFSLLCGYSFAQQDRTKLMPCNTAVFDTTIVNTDTMLDGFKMHVVHIRAEYDFTKEESRFGPRIGLYYDWQVGGKRVFKTNMGGGTLGLDISWDL